MASIYDWSTTAANNATADASINWAEGQDPGSVNDSARQEMGRVAEFRNDITGTITAGGTANALTVTANSGFTTLANGRMVAFIAASDNTTAATLNVNGIGAKSIRKMDGSGDAALVAGEIQAGGVYLVVYNTAMNGAAGGWLLINPTEGIQGTFTPVMKGASTAGAGTYTTQTGFYTRIGNVVTYAIQLAWSAHTGTGTMFLDGLPFTSAASIFVGSTIFINMTFANIPYAYVIGGSTQIQLGVMASATGFGTVAMDTAATVYVTGTYLAA
jgi:hypothetical protein